MSYTNGLSPDLIMPEGKAAIKEWAENAVLYYANNLSVFTSDSIRSDVKQDLVNLDLYNGINHVETFIGLVNPLSLETINSTRAIRHYPIAAPIIDLVVGEEINRVYEPDFHIVNNIGIKEKSDRRDAYIQKEIEKLEEQYNTKLQEAQTALETGVGGDQESGGQEKENEKKAQLEKVKKELTDTLEEELTKLKKHLNTTYKDIIEMKYGALVSHYFQELDMRSELIEGFRYVWLQGGEGYEIDIVHDEPTFRVLNNTKVRRTGTNRSNRWEDSDAIMLEDMYSPGYVINRYPELNEEEIIRITEAGSGLDNGKNYGDVTREFVPLPSGGTKEDNSVFGTEFNNNYSDSDGNVRHARIRFQGFRKVRDIYYQDKTTGEQQVKTRPMKYKPLPGEKVWRTRYVGQWWIGTVILQDIVVDVRPNPVPLPKMNNPTEAHPGIVGLTFNVAQEKAIAPMTKMAPYQNLYDLIMDDVIKSMSKNIGPILEMDFSKKPKKWPLLKWLGFIVNHNVKFTDSFKEVNRGPAMGQLAGNVASGRDQVLDVNYSTYIQQLLQLAAYVKQAMSEVVGITPQRMGSIATRENVGSVERATSQSSHVTEWYFYRHSIVRDRAVDLFAEACKYSLKSNPKKLNLILGNRVRELVEVTEEDFANADLGISSKDTKRTAENQAVINQAAQAFMQNGGNFGFVFEILNSSSMAEKRALIRSEEEATEKRAMEARQGEQQAAKAQLDAAAQEKNKDRELKKYQIDIEAETKIKLKEMDALLQADVNSLSRQESADSLRQKIMELNAQMEQKLKEEEAKDREADQKDRELDIQEKQVEENNIQTK